MTPRALAALHARCFEPPLAWSADSFEGLLRSPGVTLLAEGHSAFALVRIVADEAELLTIATDPGFRRQGLGRLLMDRIEQHARSHGARVVHLELAEDNSAALALYLACGFAPVGRRPGYFRNRFGHPVDALLLSRTLPRA